MQPGDNIPFLSIDHVQLAMPAGEEEKARDFYVGILGMTEIEKPIELRERNGAWFASGNTQLHLGADAEFTPAKKAHPALRCRDYASLLQALTAAGVSVRPEEIPFVDGSDHAYVSDPFGNRIELIASVKKP